MVNLVDPQITEMSGWDTVDAGSTVIYNVDNGAPSLSTAVVFLGSDNNHIWFDLVDPLVEGNTYQVSVNLTVGYQGFTGPFEISYYEDGVKVNSEEITLVEGSQTITSEFVAGTNNGLNPSIRLVGWGNGANGEYIVFDEVIVEETAQGGDTVDVVSDPYAHPMGSAESFSEDTLEARGGRLETFPEPTTMEDFQTVVQRDFNSFMEWGEEDTVVMPASESPFDERFFRTTMLAGTSSGSDVEGGTGWEGANIDGGADHAALRYRVRFQDNFDWVKGGKLPGLYGGDSPSGGASPDNGFTTRMMWRTDGQGELYAYVMNKENSSGDSLGRGMFTFVPGIWHTIEQEVHLNTVDPNTGDVYNDGWTRIWFDGQPVFVVKDMIFRDSNAVTIDGIMSTIFFGGADESWRTPVDQWIDTGDFKIWVPSS